MYEPRYPAAQGFIYNLDLGLMPKIVGALNWKIRDGSGPGHGAIAIAVGKKGTASSGSSFGTSFGVSLDTGRMLEEAFASLNILNRRQDDGHTAEIATSLCLTPKFNRVPGCVVAKVPKTDCNVYISFRSNSADSFADELMAYVIARHFQLELPEGYKNPHLEYAEAIFDLFQAKRVAA